MHHDIAVKPMLVRKCPYEWCTYSTDRPPNFRRHKKTQHGGPDGRKVPCKARKAKALQEIDGNRQRGRESSQSSPQIKGEPPVKSEPQEEHVDESASHDDHRSPQSEEAWLGFHQKVWTQQHHKDVKRERDLKHESAQELTGGCSWPAVPVPGGLVPDQHTACTTEQLVLPDWNGTTSNDSDTLGDIWAMNGERDCSTLAPSDVQSLHPEDSATSGLHNLENEYFEWMDWDQFNDSGGNYDWENEDWPLDMADLSVADQGQHEWLDDAFAAWEGA
ncbi:hypothetical protein Slin15195_G124350 [Septoria linicola]|uniref:Uncharacterized protein n=1 Tax=Septoria linicola TaxID=215465 RepID=A0A9Q9EPT8_9PEZI|nr:hypothetical protein Slin14017_G080560 [Septoria linicola]USW59116.1 hypothetical protein Slin15195_G124350 [Septoria linicola]